MPSASLAASDIRSLVQGGSKVSSSLTPVTPGTRARGALHFGRQGAGHGTVRRGQGHADEHLAGIIDIDAVDQAEFVDVDRHLRVVDLLEGGDDLVFAEHSRGHSIGAGCQPHVTLARSFVLPACQLGGQRGFQGVPGQRGAFDARRIIAHAAEDDQFAEVLADGGIGGQELVEFLQQLERFLAGSCP